MQQWEAKWLMEFNPDKCEVITITNKRSHINYPYNIHGKELKHVQHAKYLGLTFSNNLSWNKHIDNITKKANVTCAFLRRNINSCSRQGKAQCYTTLVRPNLEYAATVWDPYTKFNINKLEKCQRRAARFVNGDYSRESSVTSMLRDRPFNLKDNTRVRIFIFFVSQSEIFFPEFNIRLYMTKTLNPIIIFYLHQNQNIFFSNIGNQNIFFRKKAYPPPFSS
jgi:hypothetical protein